ncbi:MAG TPA: hypothetical protein PKO15_18715 [Fibrobacteria bacterium]|nr:hypothetical protein [Fibrobacteria bacterium]
MPRIDFTIEKKICLHGVDHARPGKSDQFVQLETPSFPEVDCRLGRSRLGVRHAPARLEKRLGVVQDREGRDFVGGIVLVEVGEFPLWQDREPASILVAARNAIEDVLSRERCIQGVECA